jgi:hypothetical protein
MQTQTNYVRLNHNRARVYRIVLFALLVWAVVILFISVLVSFDVYWFSYYAVDYTFGFVRRGLAGEMVSIFPAEHYFTVAKILRWSTTAIYVAGLAAVAWLVLFHGGRSERRIMLALLIPVLPFGLAFAIYSARPDLLGAATFIAYCCTLTTIRSARSLLACSAIYGVSIAVLGLIHEAIALEFALGAILAILTLTYGISHRLQRLAVILSIGPGMVSALLIFVLGRRGVASQLCAKVPHKNVDELTLKVSIADVVNYIVGRRQQIDYHQWVCSKIIPMYDYSAGDAIKVVADIGIGLLALSLFCGVLVIGLTLYSINYFSGVPFRQFMAVFRARLIWPMIGLALIIPVFLTGYDWLRWCIIISFNIAIVYILFTLNAPQLEEEPTPRNVQVFVIVVIILALLPIGVFPGFGDLQMA